MIVILKKIMWIPAYIFMGGGVVCFMVAFLLTAERMNQTFGEWMKEHVLWD